MKQHWRGVVQVCVSRVEFIKACNAFMLIIGALTK